jgi:hypothetical protein
MKRLPENTVINIKNKSHSVTAQVEVPDDGAEGVIISQGGAFAGWSLYLTAGVPKYCYNVLGLQRFTIDGNSKVCAGKHQLRMEFAYDGGGLAKGGTVTLYLDGDNVGEGRVDATVPMIFSADGPCDIGSDTASPVTTDYNRETSHFTGRIDWVQIDIDDAAENLDHLISPNSDFRSRWRVSSRLAHSDALTCRCRAHSRADERTGGVSDRLPLVQSRR